MLSHRRSLYRFLSQDNVLLWGLTHTVRNIKETFWENKIIIKKLLNWFANFAEDCLKYFVFVHHWNPTVLSSPSLVYELPHELERILNKGTYTIVFHRLRLRQCMVVRTFSFLSSSSLSPLSLVQAAFALSSVFFGKNSKLVTLNAVSIPLCWPRFVLFFFWFLDFLQHQLFKIGVLKCSNIKSFLLHIPTN